ncbi:MAG TPA: hypothetical protein VEW03_05225 [Longimicrobiaceae bacterium]|nr:hypothetical protein [Longimicrobiaceae bacterium]
MKRPLWVFALLAAAACDSGPKVVVRASLDEGGPIADLPVRLLPYDRQAILDSIAAEREEPEPVLPQDVIQRLRAIQAEEARRAPGGDSALARLRAERLALTARADSFTKAREAWLADLREPYEKAKQAALGSDSERADTTDASGRAELEAGEGKWWLVARYVLPESVLEWEIPLAVRPDSTVVVLTRANARETPLLP